MQIYNNRRNFIMMLRTLEKKANTFDHFYNIWKQFKINKLIKNSPPRLLIK